MTPPVPPVLQADEHDCGEAVYSWFLRLWESRGRRVRSHPLHGTHPDQLEPAFREAGFGVLSGEMDVQSLRDYTRRGWAVACLVQCEGFGHWVAVYGVSRGGVWVMDPAAGAVRHREADFVARWRDFDRRNTPYIQFGIIPWM